MKIIGLSLFLGVSGFGSYLFAQPQILIESGIAKAEIVTAAQAPDPSTFAAHELQKYLQETTGALCPIVDETKASLGKFKIYVGDCAFARGKGIKTQGMKSDEFRILSGDGWLIIAGKDYLGEPMAGYNNPWRIHESYNENVKVSAFGDRGTLFGVYYFLQTNAGVRWYMPGKLGTVIQKSSLIKINKIDLIRAPAFEHRHAYFGFMSTSDDDALWYRRAGFGTPSPVTIAHSFGFYFLKYAQTNPEFFALIDGQRDFTNLSTIMGPGNLDLSNQKLIEKAAEDIIHYFDEDPSRKVFPLCPNDGMLRISDNPESQSQIDLNLGELGKFSNYVWKFVNEVAIRVAKKHPDKLVGCIAYESYTLPPSRIEKLSPNVAVMICKQRRNFTNAAYRDKINRSMTEWSKKATTLYNWEYYCDILLNSAWRGFPSFYPSIVQADLKSLKGISRGEVLEAESWTQEEYAEKGKTKINYPGLQHPLLYTTGQLYWDPLLNLDELLSEYYRLFYGPAEAPMKRFWQTIEKAWMAKNVVLAPLQMSETPHQIFKRENLIEMVKCLNEAASLTPEGSDFRQRIDLIKNEFTPAAESAERLLSVAKPKIEIAKIDPDLVDSNGFTPAFWKSLDLASFLSREYQKASPATHLRMAWDQNNLYLHLICFEPHMEKIKALASKPDQSFNPAVWNDDSLEVFIGSKPDKPNECYQLIWNPQGALYDGFIQGNGNQGDKTWSSHAQLTIQKEAKNWTSTVAIPWKSLGIQNPEPGRSLIANVYRNRQAGGTFEPSFWAPLMGGANFSPNEFGEIILGK